MNYQPLIALVAALLIAILAFRAADDYRFTLGGKSAASRLEGYAAADRRGLTDKIGDSVIARLGLDLNDWKFQLRWAQLGDRYMGEGIGRVFGRSLLLGGAGILYILMFQAYSPMFLAFVILAAYFPYLQLRGRADDVRKDVRRALPEAAAFIAAEIAAGNSAETSLTRAAQLPGALGRILREAVDVSQQSGRPIFSRDQVDGLLVEHMRGLEMSNLTAFAAQLDLVASKGSDGPRQMSEIARSLAREYRSDIARAAGKLENQLLLPMSIFFFIPFMAAVFIPLFVSIFLTF